ncbi:hypothetical protein R6Q59_030065 [Mikania micrantha]
MADMGYEEPKASKLPAAALILRVTTLVTLAVSMSFLRYVFFGIAAGLFYILLHLPFDLYFFFRKKRLINNHAFLIYDFYGDKVCMILLATAVGSLFGATVETNSAAKHIEWFGKELSDAKDYHSKMREYCMLAHISAVFLLIGCFCSLISSVISSRALFEVTWIIQRFSGGYDGFPVTLPIIDTCLTLSMQLQLLHLKSLLLSYLSSKRQAATTTTPLVFCPTLATIGHCNKGTVIIISLYHHQHTHTIPPVMMTLCRSWCLCLTTDGVEVASDKS